MADGDDQCDLVGQQTILYSIFFSTSPCVSFTQTSSRWSLLVLHIKYSKWQAIQLPTNQHLTSMCRQTISLSLSSLLFFSYTLSRVVLHTLLCGTFFETRTRVRIRNRRIVGFTSNYICTSSSMLLYVHNQRQTERRC